MNVTILCQYTWYGLCLWVSHLHSTYTFHCKWYTHNHLHNGTCVQHDGAVNTTAVAYWCHSDTLWHKWNPLAKKTFIQTLRHCLFQWMTLTSTAQHIYTLKVHEIGCKWRIKDAGILREWDQHVSVGYGEVRVCISVTPRLSQMEWQSGKSWEILPQGKRNKTSLQTLLIVTPTQIEV